MCLTEEEEKGEEEKKEYMEGEDMEWEDLEGEEEEGKDKDSGEKFLSPAVFEPSPNKQKLVNVSIEEFFFRRPQRERKKKFDSNYEYFKINFQKDFQILGVFKN